MNAKLRELSEQTSIEHDSEKLGPLKKKIADVIAQVDPEKTVNPLPTNQSSSKQGTRIFIVDDNGVLREKIRLLLAEARPDWEVVGEAGDGLEAIQAITTLGPDIVLLDVSMPSMGGIETVRRIRELHLAVGVILLTVHDPNEFADAAKKAGANGCISKTQVGRDLLPAINSVICGGTFFPLKAQDHKAGAA